MSQVALRPAAIRQPFTIGLVMTRVAASVSRLADAWRLDRAVTHVQSLEGRLLQDIGLGASEIEHAVRMGRRPRRGTTASPRLPATADGLPASWTEWR